jgi:MFS family permease
MGGGGEALQHSNGLSCATGRIVTWRLVPLLFLCYVVNQMDRINIGFAHLQMRPELGFSDAVYGLAASLFFVGYILFEVPSNLLLDRIGGGKRSSEVPATGEIRDFVSGYAAPSGEAA